MGQIKIEDLNYIKGVGTIILGKILSGTLKEGDYFELNGKRYFFGLVKVNNNDNQASTEQEFQSSIRNVEEKELFRVKWQIISFYSKSSSDTTNSPQEQEAIKANSSGLKSFLRKLFGK